MPLTKPANGRIAPSVARSGGEARFIYLTEVDLSLDNGPGINEREFVTALRSRYPHQVIPIVPSPARPEVHRDDGLQYVRPHRGHPARYPAYLASAFRRVAALQRRHAIAGAIFRLGSTPLLPWATRHVLGIPVLLKGLGLYASFGNDPEMRESRSMGARRAGIVGRFFAPVYRSLVREVPIADTVSDVYAEWLHHTFGIPRDRILVIPNGANVQVFSPGDTAAARRELGLDRFDYVVGYVGSLTTIRHVDLLVRSIGALAPASNVGLVLVGDGKDRANLQSLATELGVQDRVIFVGSVPYRRVPSYVRAFDVAADLTLVTMRVGDRILRTSYSQKIPQYLACGVPVVAWDVDGTHFLSSQRIGAVARVTDLASLIDAFRRLIEMGDPERRDMRQRAREFAESHLAVDRLASQRVEAWRSALRELRV